MSTHLHLRHIGIRLIPLVAAYLVVFRLRSMEIGPEWLRFHLTDFLFIPTLLLSVQAAGHLLGRPIRMSWGRVTAAVIYAAVVFEAILPRSGMAFEGDFIDVCCYVAGGFAYVFMCRPPSEPAVDRKHLPRSSRSSHHSDGAITKFKTVSNP